MRKFSAFLLCYFLLFFIPVAFCDNRYEYLGYNDNGTFYIDTTNIIKKHETILFKIWLKEIVSEAGKNNYILRQQNYERKKLLQNLSHVLYCSEINLLNNTYRNIEILYYSNNEFLFYDVPYMNWQNIPPNTFIEFARDIVERIFQDKSLRENENNINKYMYIFVSLLAGVVVSVLLVMFIKNFMPDKNNPDNGEENTNLSFSSSKTEDNEDVIDAILIEKKDEVSEKISSNTRETFLSRITLIEKIFICFVLLNIVLIFLTLSEFLPPLEGVSIQQSRQIIKSSFLTLCAWFSVRYSFYRANQLTDKGLARFIKFLGIFICLLIPWAYGKGYI